VSKRIILLLVIFASLAMAVVPSTGDITIRFRDAQQRPIVNVSVTFEYTATDPIYGELHKTDVQYSNSFGVVDKRLSADFNTPYHITMAYHDSSQVIDSTWTGGFDRFVNLPLTDFSVRTIDTEGNPIPNVPLRVEVLGDGEFMDQTNGTGYKIFSQYNRDLVYTVHARYGSKDTSSEIVPDAQLHTMQIPTYTLEVRAFNENGTSIFSNITVSYFAITDTTKVTTGASGRFTQIPEGNVTVTLRYRNRTAATTFYLNDSISKSILLDLSPPQISNLRLSPEKPVPENEVLVYADIFDPGLNASGMPPLINAIPPAELYYSLDGVAWKSVHMFPQPDNRTYVGKIPGQPRDQVVRYYIAAWDNANNTGKSSQFAFNTFINGTGDGVVPPGPDLMAIISPFWWLIFIPIIGAAAYYLKKRYF